MKPEDQLTPKYRKYKENIKRAMKTYIEKNGDAHCEKMRNYYYLHREEVLKKSQEKRDEKKRLQAQENNKNLIPPLE